MYYPTPPPLHFRSILPPFSMGIAPHHFPYFETRKKREKEGEKGRQWPSKEMEEVFLSGGGGGGGGGQASQPQKGAHCAMGTFFPLSPSLSFSSPFFGF